ncbi:hypothetical protein [Aeromicrobium sp. CTD01-1L150]|uniref:hypothetical protein n=1 Tax=Aeromicrobium sp. CTD01-1L150 TaxID=3341830 RepID=UPI0035C2515E
MSQGVGARIPQTEMNGLYGDVLKIVMRKMLGSVPESAGVMWNHPAVFKDMMRFGGRTDTCGAET